MEKYSETSDNSRVFISVSIPQLGSHRGYVSTPKLASSIGLVVVTALLTWVAPVLAQDVGESQAAEVEMRDSLIPVLRHIVVTRVAPEEDLRFTATLSNCSGCTVYAYVRTDARSFFARFPMKLGPEDFGFVLEAHEVHGSFLHYYIEARSVSGDIVAHSARYESPHIVFLDATMKAPPPATPSEDKTTSRTTRPNQQRSHCRVGSKVSYIHYEEPGLMTESGVLWGLAAQCRHGTRTYAQLGGHLSAGWVDYDGMLSDGRPYQVQNNFNTLLELRSLVGTQLWGQLRGYLGIGYRRLFDKFSHDRAGYDRTSQYVYSPLGAVLAFRLGSTKVETHAEYRHFWAGRQTSELSDFSRALPDVSNRQRSGHGWSLAASFDTRGIALRPYLNYWSIDNSDVEQIIVNGEFLSVVEPKNNSTEVGFEVVHTF